jgi:hypothetical protein
MKIIKITSCEDCPYLKFECEGREHYYCDHKKGHVLACEREIVVEEPKISSLTMVITPVRKKWTYVLDDEKTEWDSNKFPEWCPLEDII